MSKIKVANPVVELDGVSDSMFAVPWVALRREGDMVRIDGMDRDRLRGAPSFAARNWPADWSDDDFGRKVGNYYSRPVYREGMGDARWTAMKASDMKGRNVKNLAGENVGDAKLEFLAARAGVYRCVARRILPLCHSVSFHAGECRRVPHYSLRG